MFEDNQRDLESATETLSGYLEKEFEESEAAPVNPIAIKQKIVDSSAYCESRRVILIQHVHDGYDESFWIYRQNISDKKLTIPAEGSN
jgi:ariadne-1